LQVRGGGSFGNLAPLLYQRANSVSYSTIFHDVTSGSNGYSAGTGWDPVTGWGTPIANNLAVSLAQNLVTTDKTTYTQGDSIQYSGSGFTAFGLTQACLSTDNDGTLTCVGEPNADVYGNVAGSMVVGTNIPAGAQKFYVEDLATGRFSSPVQLTIFSQNTQTLTATVTVTTTQPSTVYSAATTQTVTSYTSTSTSTSTIQTATTIVLVPVTSTVQGTQYQTSLVTTTVTSYTSTSTSTSIIPTITTVTVTPPPSTVQATQVITSTGTTTVTGYTTATTTSYTSTQVSTSTTIVVTTVTTTSSFFAGSILSLLSVLALAVRFGVEVGRGRAIPPVALRLGRRCLRS
jgi:hypothetical protein